MTPPEQAPGEARAATLPLVGDHVALDFANTVDWRDRPDRLDHLPSYEVLIGWARHAGLLDREDAASLQRRAKREPAVARSFLRRAIDLREASHRLFRAEADGKPADPDDLATLNEVLRQSRQQGDIVRTGSGYAWRSAAQTEPLARPVELLAQASAELLLSPELRRVRLCAGPDCAWLFLDTSPNRRRRWCSMESCGNRAKARRHHERVRKSS
jgi:predicted RNA-binding Zn ribbon-like protein